MMREFFYLQKSDRKVILALLAVIVVALGVILFTSSPRNSSIYRNSRDSSHARNASNSPLPTRQVERFPFDPNTADSSQLRRLGLQSWQIRNIYKFRASGGICDVGERRDNSYSKT